jgi:glycosyltransferase involved in cell wall biosynthesis
VSSKINNLKVLHVVTTIDSGGAEKHLLSLAKMQKKLGNSVSVVSIKGNDELALKFREEGIEVFSQNRSFFKFLIVFLKHFRDNSIILHAHLPRAELFVYLAVTVLHSKHKFVLSRHNQEVFLPSLDSKYGLFVSGFLSRIVTRRANAVIAISHEVESFLKRNSELYLSTPIYVVHYGIGSELVTERRTSDRLRKIGTVARLVEQKNLSFLLEALKNINEPELKVEIVGKGELRDKLIKEIQDLKIEKMVTILEGVPNIQAFYETLDLFILPSKYEGFGLVILEAINSNIPILAARIPIMEEILGSDFEGLFKLDSISDLVSLIEDCQDPNFRNFLLSRQKLVLKRFTLERMINNTNWIYETILSNRKGCL